MFTGLVQDIGSVESVEGGAEGARLRIATRLAPEIAPGDSVAVNGVCLTAIEDGASDVTVDDAAGTGSFLVEAMNQTLDVTVIGALEPGARVNLELATRADERLGGHIVQGHADGSGRVLDVSEDGFARRVRVEIASDLLRYVVDKGSVALNGVSLTVAELGDTWVEVSLIPETLERTNLGDAQPGDPLNVEVDVVAKYVERLLSPFAGKEQAS
ncbi:MAG TPA: riboflavin synthase [Solirubrobacterales bacterium]|jgi:riboflavin synthase